jgi:hypothetical protein
MNLEALQRRMARAVMTPLTPGERMRNVSPSGRSMRAEARSFIKPNDRLTAFERLEIYNRQYWFRVLSAMTDDFPGLRAVLGDRSFDALSKAYLRGCPSTSFTLRNLGSRLEAWIRKHPRYAASRQQLALDMVRLEWADIAAFDGQSLPPLKAENLANADPATLRLRLQPYVQLLDLRYPVDDLLLAVKGKNQDDADFASNAFSEKHRRKRVAAVARLKPAPIFLVVHRADYFVYFRRIEREEFNILSALRGGKTLERAIDGAFRGSSIPVDERAENVAQWFHNWSALGWFCLSGK